MQCCSRNVFVSSIGPISFPAHETLGSPEKQSLFVKGVFGTCHELPGRVALVNFFMRYDFPTSLVNQLVSCDGVGSETERVANFIASRSMARLVGWLGWLVVTTNTTAQSSTGRVLIADGLHRIAYRLKWRAMVPA